MFPIRDDNPPILTPYVTYAIVVLNSLAWIFVQGMGTDPQLFASICRFGLIPGDVLQNLPDGAQVPLAPGVYCTPGDFPAWVTPLTSMFMHGGWLHIIGNMWFMWIFGNNVEDAMGHFRFAVFYILCGLAAAALQVAAAPESAIPMVGASGAIGGVMGAYILFYPRVRVHLLLVLGFFITTVAVPAVLMLGYWFVLQVLSGVANVDTDGGGVAFWAHVGGFVAGMALAFLFRDKKLLARHPYHGWHKQESPTQNWRKVKR